MRELLERYVAIYLYCIYIIQLIFCLHFWYVAIAVAEVIPFVCPINIVCKTKQHCKYDRFLCFYINNYYNYYDDCISGTQ